MPFQVKIYLTLLHRSRAVHLPRRQAKAVLVVAKARAMKVLVAVVKVVLVAVVVLVKVEPGSFLKIAKWQSSKEKQKQSNMNPTD